MPRPESILLHSTSGDGYNDLMPLPAIGRGPCPPLLPSRSLNILGSSGSFSGSRSEPMAASLILDCCGVDRHGCSRPWLCFMALWIASRHLLRQRCGPLSPYVSHNSITATFASTSTQHRLPNGGFRWGKSSP